MKQTETVENAILSFFDRNKEEELTVSDAVIKFDIAQSRATTVLNKLASRGLLKKGVEEVTKFQKRSVYSRA